MAYDWGQKEILVAKAASLGSLAIVGTLAPAFRPFILRAVGLIFTTVAGAAGVLEINWRPIAGTIAGEVVVDTIIFDGTIGAAGQVVFVDGLSQTVIPGQDLAFEITDLAATGVVDIVALIDESTESYLNNVTNMTRSA